MPIPIITICIITYNHDEFIEQAVSSALNQETNYDFKIVIADDFSTDGTRDILIKLRNKFPTKIDLILQKTNVGPAQNWIDLIKFSKSKYLAYFEGDDYWTDPLKIEKQVKFLESNPNFSFTFHDVDIIHAHESDNFTYPIPSSNVLSFIDILINHYIPSSSLVFRNFEWVQDLPLFFKKSISGDIPFELMLASKGRVKYFPEKMACYRRNISSVTQVRKDNIFILKGYIWMYSQLAKHVPIKYFFLVKVMAYRYKLSLIKYKLERIRLK